MGKRVYLPFLLAGLWLGVALGVAGCAPVADSTPAPTPIPDELGWRDIPLTDVISGEEFTLSGFEGQVVIVDLMAVWCINCLLQQQQIQIASAHWSDDEVVVVSLDVEPNETQTILRNHAQDNNIAWRSAVAPQSMIDRLVAEFGVMAINVTATPLIFISPDGSADLIGRGLKPRDVLLDLVAERQ